MDNNFENEFYGYEPQRPLTEKQEIPPAVQPALDMETFEPQKPLLRSEPPAQPSEEQGFNPIRHTAVYAEDGFVGESASDEAPAAPFADAPEMSEGAGDSADPPVPFAPHPPHPPQVPNGAAAPPVPPAQPAPPAGMPYAYYPPAAPPAPTYAREMPPAQKSGTNTALIVVIIVLGALLTASLFGLVAYSIYHVQTTDSGKSRSQQGIDFTLPEREKDNGGGFFDDPQTTTKPAAEHKESDFSEQADKNYGGLVLADKPEDAKTNSEYSAEYAFKTASDSVVSVLCFKGSTDDNRLADSQGSGIVISADGLVVTNSHVINNSKTAYAIKVVTADNKEYTAGVIGYDSRTDLAVLKMVNASGLKAATFGNSDALELGEDLIVIGNPGGLEYKNSMTKGIVSAVNRDASSKNMVKYIQTDAAINPGNSGGPAVNNCGQVVGVASAKIVTEAYEGMGFCIPSTLVKQITDSLIRNGYVEGRVKIGIMGTAVTASEAEYKNLPKGILVSEVIKGGPCDGTDVRADDVIIGLDGRMITSFAEMYQTLEEYKEGDKVKLKVYRPDDGKEHEIEITLQADK